MSLLIHQSINQSSYDSINHFEINTSINQSVNNSFNWSNNQSRTQPIKKMSIELRIFQATRVKLSSNNSTTIL